MVRIIFSFLFLFAATVSSFASGLPKKTFSFRPTDFADTTKKDSLISPVVAMEVKEAKGGFKDLFVNDDGEINSTEARLNPMAVTFVLDYISKFGKSMESLKANAKPYFDMMDLILKQNRLPKELKYLAVIESNLMSGATSWAGAVGPWQLMPATGRSMGLTVNRKIDERKDLYKSTYAASKYLKSLYALYGDWLLVIAAYNGGPGNVNKAIRKSGSKNFWVLQKYLPAESRKHVKKFIATHYIMEGEGGVTTLTKAENEDALNAALTATAIQDTPPDTALTTKHAISGRYSSLVIVKFTQIGSEDFARYNPNFDRQISSMGKYELQLPLDKMDIFKARKLDILYESLQMILQETTSKLNDTQK